MSEQIDCLDLGLLWGWSWDGHGTWAVGGLLVGCGYFIDWLFDLTPLKIKYILNAPRMHPECTLNAPQRYKYYFHIKAAPAI